MDITFHVAPHQAHQSEHACWWASGLKRHGLNLRITHDPNEPADIHIVSGPHFAKQYWSGHPRTIWLDRAYYHEEKGQWKSMSWVSLGWMRPDGGRTFSKGHGRPSPIIEENYGEGSIFLADYGGPIEKADTVRRHPEEESPKEPLRAALQRHGVAIGYQTTALVTAALQGLTVYCKDKRNIMSESDWLELLPYADWRYAEIMNGDAWAHLCQQIS